MTAPFDYVILRCAPRVERAEFINVGAILYCRELGYLAAAWDFTPERLHALYQDADPGALKASLEHICAICAGDPAAGPAAKVKPNERFGWLAAPRSTVIHAGPIHSGITNDPAADLERLIEEYVG
ncbi:DUF3037 domain-containing protein [Kribbella sandramycini]|uniref:DUF3037 domain-containing protein n=1 Tax=Kribbella sandramycini TaxID=60450 RepID=A0A7Y4L6G5_9ACTN|nr:DUF3037 domain-containing protein [Kribbella sandramycini]MBB6570386.1 hypothetical protein [Kribbella sandramycini]NOL45248.1 DUF3037 domain-containing protein [Kribbella sandramycini]